MGLEFPVLFDGIESGLNLDMNLKVISYFAFSTVGRRWDRKVETTNTNFLRCFLTSNSRRPAGKPTFLQTPKARAACSTSGRMDVAKAEGPIPRVFSEPPTFLRNPGLRVQVTRIRRHTKTTAMILVACFVPMHAFSENTCKRAHPFEARAHLY